MVGIRRHNPEEDLQHVHAALDLAGQPHSPGYIGRKLHTLHTQLQPMRADPRIAALDDRITGLLTAA